MVQEEAFVLTGGLVHTPLVAGFIRVIVKRPPSGLSIVILNWSLVFYCVTISL